MLSFAFVGDTVVAKVAEVGIKKKSLFLHADMPISFRESFTVGITAHFRLRVFIGFISYELLKITLRRK